MARECLRMEHGLFYKIGQNALLLVEEVVAIYIECVFHLRMEVFPVEVKQSNVENVTPSHVLKVKATKPLPNYLTLL